ncbi:MAG: thioredoxin domain-containing protein [Phycisphaerales bacterium]|nr:thioredoxin domain-containing protein [Phycisphaerales bacterium]
MPTTDSTAEHSTNPNAEPKHTNLLVDESSPYLLQHAHNPVDWYPWSDEAFAEAVKRDVPVFLSIGYSTCYWCHVMERESFENEEIAAQMNKQFVCIKVDREERPDVDEIYMAATQIFSGSGGWPMSVFLEPKSRKPFYAGTYFPAKPMYGRPSFPQILDSLSGAYKNQHAEVIQQAESIAEAVREQVAQSNTPVPVGNAQITRTTSGLLQRFDRTNGGFGGSPKFPQPVYLEYLMDMRGYTDDDTADAIDAVMKTTLDKMALGGINDQIGGGFHRYATDAIWLVPHFEKMLYDNAQLAHIYARATVVYNDSLYARTVRRTLDYVLTEMTDPGDPGVRGFFSAQDAEVDGREGLNYLWVQSDFDKVLGDDTDFASKVYGLDAGTNFQDPHHPDEPPRNVLRLSNRPDQLAPQIGMALDAFLDKLDAINAKLYSAREQRKQPRLDDKVSCGWNGMIISGLVAGGEAVDEPRYIEAAEHAAEFLYTHMRTENGQLARAYRAGKAKIPGLLEDYAMCVQGLLALHRSKLSRDENSLPRAIELMEQARTDFGDPDGGYHDTRADRTDLFVRSRSVYDGAVPSGISVMFANLVELADLTQEDLWVDRAVGALRSMSSPIARNGIGVINSTRQLLGLMTMSDLVGSRYQFLGEEDSTQDEEAVGPVTVFVDTDTVSVDDDTPAEFMIAVEIADGFHIVAAEPGEGESTALLVPLRVGLISGQGVAVYADYPKGDEYGVESVGTINVHTGRIEFKVAIEKAVGVGPTPGEPILGITYQACTDTACQQPRTVELKIAVQVQ